jgi:hypothetical protein
VVMLLVKQQTAATAVETGRFNDGGEWNISDKAVVAGQKQIVQLRSIWGRY